MVRVIDKEMVGYYVNTSHFPNIIIHSQITKKKVADKTGINYLEALHQNNWLMMEIESSLT